MEDWRETRDVRKLIAVLAGAAIVASMAGCSSQVGGENESGYTQAHLADEKLGCILQPLDTLPEDWLKVVFAGESALLEQIEAFAAQNSYPGVYFLRTNTIYYEIMPQGVSKASGLERLCARLALPMENVIFIGDYYNDLDLMRLAGHSVAVANAPRDVQAQADEVTMSRCADGGVGEYLYKLVKRYV